MPDTALVMFAEELQARREEAGLTQDQLAQKALISASLLRKIETSKRRPQSDFAEWCDKYFGCPGTFRRFHRMTLLETFPEWFASRILYEEQATVITEWELRGVPGLLQTRAYAEAMIRSCRPFDPEPEQQTSLVVAAPPQFSSSQTGVPSPTSKDGTSAGSLRTPTR